MTTWHRIDGPNPPPNTGSGVQPRIPTFIPNPGPSVQPPGDDGLVKELLIENLIYRDALHGILAETMRVRGEQAHRDACRFAFRAAREALAAAKKARTA